MADDRNSFKTTHVKKTYYQLVDVSIESINGICKHVNHYGNIHSWVRKRKPKPEPCVCEQCRLPKRLDLANISGEYLYCISDYKWLCHKCHMSMDARNRINKLLLLTNIEEK